jgi:hypothetical protein
MQKATEKQQRAVIHSSVQTNLQSIFERVDLSALPDAAQIPDRFADLIDRKRFSPELAEKALQVNRQYTASLNPKSFEDVLSRDEASLSVLRTYRGEAVATAWLISRIARLSKFFNVGRGMDDEACAMTADLILSEFYYLRISDILLCFRWAAAGKFGKVYDRFDGSTILGWLREYDGMRHTAIMDRNEQAHENKKSMGWNNIPEEWKEKIRTLAEKIDRKSEILSNSQQDAAKRFRFSDLTAFLASSGYDITKFGETYQKKIKAAYNALKSPQMDFDVFAEVEFEKFLERIAANDLPDWLEECKISEPSQDTKND